VSDDFRSGGVNNTVFFHAAETYHIRYRETPQGVGAGKPDDSPLLTILPSTPDVFWTLTIAVQPRRSVTPPVSGGCPDFS
ncbi:MAG: hypothetical protein OEQ74_12280, partial [Gammaproteobacteria bacterium]|nr:hypothetical protein [Gammaproteobacteria bacterium]